MKIPIPYVVCLIFLIAIAVVTIEVNDKIGNWQKIPESQIVINRSVLAELDSISNLPPTIQRDTVYQDTGSIVIIHKKLPTKKADPNNPTNYSIIDSLETEYFSATHKLMFTLTDKEDSVISNTWGYRVFGPKEITNTIKKYVPKPVRYDVVVPSSGLWLQSHTDVSSYLISYGLGLNKIKGRYAYGAYVERQLLFDQSKSISVGVTASLKLSK